MASVKIKFRPSTVAGKEGSVYYQVIHQRKVCHVPTAYRLFPSEWDNRASSVMVPSGASRAPLVAFMRESIRLDLGRLSRIVRNLDDKGIEYTADDVLAAFESYSRDCSLKNFACLQIGLLRGLRRPRTADNYLCALRSFIRFLSADGHPGQPGVGGDIMLDALSSPTVEAYEAWLKATKVSQNSISCYMRTLRAIYNRAVDIGIIEQQHPFRHVYTGIGKTVKRTLSVAEMRRLKYADFPGRPHLEYARDIFLLSFYLRGMSFIDMAFLDKSNLHNGYLTYWRHKTGQRLDIAWTVEMQEIVDKYPENNSRYLLPILIAERDDGEAACDDRGLYRAACNRINRNLKDVASVAGILTPLTTYCARHSWASIAKAQGVPLSVISDGMGHESEKTTRIYLASLDTSDVDRANDMVIDAL